MKQKRLFIIAVLSLALWTFCWAYGLNLGTSAADFKVVSGDGKILTRQDILGKATGIFYETTDVVKQNMALKNALGKYYDAQPNSVRNIILRLPVINCSGVFLPLRAIYRSEFRKHSAEENITIYGDWTGRMFSDYNIQDGVSNVFLIDKKGVIRYYSAGRIADAQIDKVVALFKKLVEE